MSQQTHQVEMARYDEQFEQRIELYRRRQRALVAANIHFKSSRADFKDFCKGKLSDLDSVKFFWRDPQRSGNLHDGFVVLAFDTRVTCQRAVTELKALTYRGRDITIKRASSKAIPPRKLATELAASVTPTISTSSTSTAPITNSLMISASSTAASTATPPAEALPAPAITTTTNTPASPATQGWVAVVTAGPAPFLIDVSSEDDAEWDCLEDEDSDCGVDLDMSLVVKDDDE